MDVGDLLKVTVKQRWSVDNTAIFNMMTFKCTFASSSFELNTLDQATCFTFFSTYWDTVRGIQTTLLAYDSVLFENLNAWATEFREYVPTTPLFGGITSDSLPMANAYSIELLRTFRTTRNGSKRIAAIPEIWTSGNLITDAIGATAVANCVAALGLGWHFRDGSTAIVASFAPVITNKPIGHAPPTVVNPVIGASFKGLGTQGTRKPGRGI